MRYRGTLAVADLQNNVVIFDIALPLISLVKLIKNTSSMVILTIFTISVNVKFEY